MCGVSPPRADGKLKPTRAPSRPERHFVDSFITCRLVIARAIARWLPRCPFCHRFSADPESVNDKGFSVGDSRLALLVDKCLVAPLKAVEPIAPVHVAQPLSYLKASRLTLALLITFSVRTLRQGTRRVVLGR